MAEPSALMLKARDLLATPSHEPLTIIVDLLYTPRVSIEHQTARALYDFCVANFLNCLTLMLLKVYRCSSDGVTRFRSILLLSETLKKIRNLGCLKLSPVALNDIKPSLISCLKMPNSTKCDNRTIRIVVSCVASSVVMFDNGRWDELGDCILSLLNTDPLKAFNVFHDLPPVHGRFIDIILQKLREEIYKVLLHPHRERDDEWTLAFETAIKLGIQVSDTEARSDILDTLLRSAEMLVSMGMEKSLKAAVHHLFTFLTKDASLCKWSTNQCGYVSEFAVRIAGIGTQTKEIAKKIHQMVTKLVKYDPNPGFRISPSRVVNQDYGLGQDRDLYCSLRTFSVLEITSHFVVKTRDERSREIAMRRIHDLLCEHTSGGWELDVSEIENLQPMLIHCLVEEGMPENTFKILGKVIFHVAKETFSNGNDPWSDLWDYIASESKEDFSKAVYIFQCLTMRLHGKEGFVILALNNLLPQMCTKLNPPREVLVDNSRWVLAFTGAFCAVIRLLNVPIYAGIVQEISLKMIETVRVLVERKMEVGLVRRAFRDLERIVEEQWNWYESCEYRFVKGLVRRLIEINGMKKESKMVLWRINGTLERSVNENFKVLSGLDWLNQPET